MQHWSSWVITSLGYFKDVFFCIDFGVMDDNGMVRIREVFVDIHNQLFGRVPRQSISAFESSI